MQMALADHLARCLEHVTGSYTGIMTMSTDLRRIEETPCCQQFQDGSEREPLGQKISKVMRRPYDVDGSKDGAAEVLCCQYRWR